MEIVTNKGDSMPLNKIRTRQKIIAAVIMFLLCMTFAAIVRGDETRITVDGPGIVELKLDVPVVTDDTAIAWEPRQPLDIQIKGPYERGTVLNFFAPKPGVYVIACDYIDFSAKRWEKFRFIVTVKGTAPIDPDPVDPDPVVPDPVVPTDVVQPAPIPLPGLRVLMVLETQDLPPKIPQAQYDAMFDGNIRDWLTANCPPGPKNTAEWRMIDDDDGFVPQDKLPHWEVAAKRPRRSLPWVIISNGTRNIGYEGPVPENSDKFLELLKRFQ